MQTVHFKVIIHKTCHHPKNVFSSKTMYSNIKPRHLKYFSFVTDDFLSFTHSIQQRSQSKLIMKGLTEGALKPTSKLNHSLTKNLTFRNTDVE